MRARRSVTRAAVVAAVLTMALAACSPPGEETPDSGDPSASTPPAVVVDPAPPLAADALAEFGGVARVDIASHCTATLIETGADAAPAYLLTNGHCIGLDNGAVNRSVVDEEGYGEARFFDVAGAAATDVLAVEVAWFEFGTMRGTDVAIVRLDATLGELREAGAVPLPIAATAPGEGVAVVNIAGPTQGLDEGDWVLRQGECTTGATVDVIEFNWLWLGSVATDCPGVLGGSSGSPLIADGEVVSIINTTNGGVPLERGDTCFLGSPCETGPDGATFVPGTSYGVDVAGVGDCFPGGVFALGGECPLQISPLGTADGGGIFGADGTDGGIHTPAVRLSAAGGGSAAMTAALPIDDAAACDDPASYGEPVAVSDDEWSPTEVPVTLPSENGFVLVCAAVPGEEALAARFVFAIDTVAPTVGPQLSVQDLADGAIMVDPLFDIPDIANISVLFGPPATTDCADRDAYAPYFRQSYFLDPPDLPARFCAIGFDMAGNESPVTEQVLGE